MAGCNLTVTESSGQGVRYAAECVCCDNELSGCSGGPDSPDRLGGAIVVRGEFTLCEGNFVSNSRVGISVQLDGSSCHVHDNLVTGVGAGSTPGTAGGAGIVIDHQAFQCVCTCNHVRALQGSVPYDLGSASHGPIVALSSGDMSLLPGSSHPLVNLSSQAPLRGPNPGVLRELATANFQIFDAMKSKELPNTTAPVPPCQHGIRPSSRAVNSASQLCTWLLALCA